MVTASELLFHVHLYSYVPSVSSYDNNSIVIVFILQLICNTANFVSIINIHTSLVIFETTSKLHTVPESRLNANEFTNNKFTNALCIKF